MFITKKATSRARTVAAATSVLALSVVLTACGGNDDSSGSATTDTSSTASDTSAETTTTDVNDADAEPVDIEANSLAVGDCIDMSTVGSMIDTVPTVDCTTPHDGEVFALFTLEPDADFPDDLPMDAEEQVTTLCSGAFADYVGAAYEDSSIYISYITPTDATWAQGDDQLQCLLLVDEPVTTSIAGSGL